MGGGSQSGSGSAPSTDFGSISAAGQALGGAMSGPSSFTAAPIQQGAPIQQPPSLPSAGQQQAQSQDFELLMDDLYQRMKARAAADDSGYDSYSQSSNGFSF